jgi:type II secretory pathway predicted ATPase ExeA
MSVDTRLRIHLVGQPKLCYSLHHYRVAQVAFAFAGAVLICP